MKTFFERFLRFSYRNRSLRFTASGIRFVFMTLAVGVAAINTGNNLLYLILAMLLSLVILSGILSEQSLRRLRVERVLPAKPFAGRAIPMPYKLFNPRRRLASFCFSVYEADGAGMEISPLYCYKLAATQRHLSSTSVLFHRRGRYRFTGIHLETSFPFGFFQKSLLRSQPQEVVVYPKLVPLPADFLTQLAHRGESREAWLHGPGVTIKSLRDYIPGDDARMIHWKASARQTRLLLKEHEHEEEQRLVVCLSNHLPPPAAEKDLEILEQAVSLAASLAYHGILSGFSVQLKTLDQETPMGSGLPHLFRILDLLALLEPVFKLPETEDQRERLSVPGVSSVAKVLIRPQPGSYWEPARTAFARVLTVSDPDVQAWITAPPGRRPGPIEESVR
jgi:uncharacterized protein (DUF58 family)